MSLFKKEKNIKKILKKEPLRLHWDVEDPFFFASYHSDDYPHGNNQQAPPINEIAGRNLGRDYKKIYGFRMFHGKVVPGFPLHTHWGYETVTIPEKGFIDHFDNLGNQGRYGRGDVQWISAGNFYEHNEMYPLVSQTERNPNEILQIMINLPNKSKGSDPEIKTMWSEKIPIVNKENVSIKIIAGRFENIHALSPNDVSWAADSKNNVNILKIVMSPGSKITLPAISSTLNRNLYFVEGSTVKFDNNEFEYSYRFKLPGNEIIEFENGDKEGTYWLLEGEPIGEKNVSYGPVLLDSTKAVRSAMNTIREKELKEWPWDIVDKTQPLGSERFIRYADGREEKP